MRLNLATVARDPVDDEKPFAQAPTPREDVVAALRLPQLPAAAKDASAGVMEEMPTAANPSSVDADESVSVSLTKLTKPKPLPPLLAASRQAGSSNTCVSARSDTSSSYLLLST